MGLVIFFLALQPRNQEELTFRTPLVPYLPALAIFVNIYLMMKLSLATWIRFLVWLTVGLAIYFTYGWRHSSEELRTRALQETQQASVAQSPANIIVQ